MFPTNSKGERFSDPASPKIAVYSAHPTSKPTIRLAEVKPAPGSAMRSRIKLLQSHQQAATGGWTSSSIHNPSSQKYLDATLPPSEAPMHRYQSQQQQQPGLMDPSSSSAAAAGSYGAVHPLGTTTAAAPIAVGGGGAPRTVEENLRDQVRTLETEVSMLRGGGGGGGGGVGLPALRPGGGASPPGLGGLAPVGQVAPLGGQQQQQQPWKWQDGNGVGQFPASTLPPQPGPYAPEPLAYRQPPPGSHTWQPNAPVPTAPGPHQATLGYPHAAFPITDEQPFVGAQARFQRPGSEPVKTAVKGNSLLKGGRVPSSGGAPAVEVHHESMLEQLGQKNGMLEMESRRAQAELVRREEQGRAMEAELLRLRQLAAEEQQKAQQLRRELDEFLAQRAARDAASQDLVNKNQFLQQRHDLMMEELSVLRRELDAERSVPKYEPLSAARFGGVHPYTGANDFSSSAIAAENEALKSQLAELTAQRAQRDALWLQNEQSMAAMQQELAAAQAALRHEQQRCLIALSTTESHRVLLDDAKSEVEYLRLVTGEQKLCIERMQTDHTARFERLQTEMEARQVREMHAAHAMENAKALHVESGRVQQALLAEQTMNDTLRSEVARLQKLLQDEQGRTQEILQRHDQLRLMLRQTEKDVQDRTANLENLVEAWHQQQARQASEDRGQLQRAKEALEALRAVPMPLDGSLPTGPLTADVPPIVLQVPLPGSSTIPPPPPPPAPPGNNNTNVNFTGVVHLVSTPPPPAAAAPPSVIVMPGVSPYVPPPPAPVSAGIVALDAEVKELLQQERNYRIDAEQTRIEAMQALAMQNTSLGVAA